MTVDEVLSEGRAVCMHVCDTYMYMYMCCACMCGFVGLGR